MARQLRLEFPGSLWHITARGNERRDIFRDDRDRHTFLELLGRCVKRFDWILPAYVLMSNHFHLVVQLTDRTLSKGMQWLNTTYPLRFNRRHERVGHLYQGRFHGSLIDRETYYLDVLRYVVLNPVRAGMVGRPEDYCWSSHRAILGMVPAPGWLAVDDVLAQFGPSRDVARERYRCFVEAALGSDIHLWDNLVGQMFLGSEAWLEKVRDEVALKPRADEHPRSQRMIGAATIASVIGAVAATWDVDEDRIRNGRGGVPRMVAAWIGCHEARLTNCEIAAGLRVRSSGYVSRLIQRCERALAETAQLRESVDRCIATIRRTLYEGKV